MHAQLFRPGVAAAARDGDDVARRGETRDAQHQFECAAVTPGEQDQHDDAEHEVASTDGAHEPESGAVRRGQAVLRARDAGRDQCNGADCEKGESAQPGEDRSDHRIATALRNTPMCSISTSMTSPSVRKTGGSIAKPTPSGVPVAMISPGSSVMPLDNSAMMRGIEKIIALVFEFCRVRPLTRSAIDRFCGSVSSAVSTTQGPTGHVPSSDFPLNHCWCARCRSRAVTSLRHV